MKFEKKEYTNLSIKLKKVIDRYYFYIIYSEFRMNKLQYFIFWLKYKNKVKNNNFNYLPVRVEIYSIAPHSFKISWNNYLKLI